MERISIYIDGGNFYHLVVKKLGIEENNFNFDAFANFLIDGRAVSESCKYFYKGSVPEKEGNSHSKELMSQQTKLFTNLKKSGWEINTSKLRTRVEELVVDSRVFEYKKLKKIGLETIHTERMREKGIDVKIATDLLVGAFDNKYDIAIVVSSDSDLVPAIDWVRNRMKKKIEYVGFSIPDLKDQKKSTKPLMMMFSKTNTQRILSDIEMRKFIKLTSNVWNNIDIIKVLKENKIAIIPTDTVYGMVGKAFNESTVNRIYTIRKRNPDKPCIILIGDIRKKEKFSGSASMAITLPFWPTSLEKTLVKKPKWAPMSSTVISGLIIFLKTVKVSFS